MRNPPTYNKAPKAPFERRTAAFAIDFAIIWFISGLFGGGVSWVVFIFTWLGLRVILPSKNYGQSPGRWALDIRVVDGRYGSTPPLLPLVKREGMLGFAALLASIGLTIGLANGISLLVLVTPLLADCAIAFTDEEYRQAFHDRFGQTLIVQTRRGFSLDLRAKRIVAQLTQSMRK